MQKSTVIYGPPGTGKSTEILRRMDAALSSGIPPDKIGLVSFTKTAAQELAKRIGVKPGHNISTLHSYAFRIVGLVREQVVDRTKLLELSRFSKIPITGASPHEQDHLEKGDYYLSMYNYARSVLEDDLERAFSAGGRMGDFNQFKYFVSIYEKWKSAHGYVDFADMLAMAMDKPAPDLDIIFLDEAQDFSRAQWQLIDKWTPFINEFVLALDDDQAIFKFSGAEPTGGPIFEAKHNSDRVVLGKSYRLPIEIYTFAQKTIRNVLHRVDKKYIPVASAGAIRKFGALYSTPVPKMEEDTLILVRNHFLRQEVDGWLINKNVPFITDNGTPGPLQSTIAQAISAWQTAAKDHCDVGRIFLTDKQWRALLRTIKPKYAQHIKRRDILCIISLPWHSILNMPQHLLTYFSNLQKKYGTPTPMTRINVSTIHGAKGKEADRVILLNSMSQLTVEAYLIDRDSEIRVFYVGITRAKHTLDIVAGENPLRELK